MPARLPTNIYAVFHLNLAFSCIERSQYPVVIERCYWPLLKIIEQQNIPLGIELTGYTLDSIAETDPLWIESLAKLVAGEKCEIVASGDSQIIGPLVPWKVNQYNLRLGQLAYRKHFGVEPKIAYVNEQAVSSGLLDCYIDQNFDAVIIEWDNAYSHNRGWDGALRQRPQALKSAQGRQIKVIWNQAIAFQKLQRYAHNEISLADYQSYLHRATNDNCQAFPIYGNDAEVFNFRPGRYLAETEVQFCEWNRIIDLFTSLQNSGDYKWIKPGSVLSTWRVAPALSIQNAAHPVTVKKQRKYNVTRWGLSGRNDLWLNSQCHKKYEKLLRDATSRDEDWRTLCRYWASDYRTHITERRYSELLKIVGGQSVEKKKVNRRAQAPCPGPRPARPFKIDRDSERRCLSVTTSEIAVTLDARRGLAIDSLAFGAHNFEPVVGTLPHGHFDDINFGADFYSNHLVVERFRERDRITDLNAIEYEVTESGDNLEIRCSLDTSLGTIIKWYKIAGDEIECGFEFSDSERPDASLRLGYVTLLDCRARCWYATHNGGSAIEFYSAMDDFDHGSPVSSIVSANAATGATEGKLFLGSGDEGVQLDWIPGSCAAMPMLLSKKTNSYYFNRLWFSLVESDETLIAGGTMMNFSYRISPCHRSQLERADPCEWSRSLALA